MTTFAARAMAVMFAGASVVSCGAAQPSSSPTVVSTAAGPVRGAIDNGVIHFLGIPYAAPPVGELRWRAPAPVRPWTEVRDATRFGSSCTQSADFEGPGSEDCLFLNVWSPEARSTTPRPVMFYIHGGGWVRGSGNMSGLAGVANVLDGQHLAQTHGAVVVTINYRLGSLGFLAHPAFESENSGRSAGNYGLQDVIAGLRWVRENIRAFGGDPSRVLVFGTSAGGSQTCAVIASPSADGLFSGASAHSSGGCDCFPREQSGAIARQLADTVGCTGAADVAACLRSKPAPMLASLPSSGATNDGTVLPMCPLQIFQGGGGSRVPLVFGTTLHEAMMYVDDRARSLTWEQFRQLLDRSFGARGADVAAAYPPARYESATAAWMMFAGDWIYHCPDRRVLRALAGRSTPVRRFVFGGALTDSRHVARGAVHGTDVPFVFHNFGSLSTTAAEQTLSNTMGALWYRMAANEALPTEWRAWDATGSFLGLGLDSVAVSSGWRDAECDQLDRVPALREVSVLPFPS